MSNLLEQVGQLMNELSALKGQADTLHAEADALEEQAKAKRDEARIVAGKIEMAEKFADLLMQMLKEQEEKAEDERAAFCSFASEMEEQGIDHETLETYAKRRGFVYEALPPANDEEAAQVDKVAN